MYYIYTISFNGIIFYVGMTKQPCARYVNHYTDTTSAIHKITRYLLLQGIICDMEVIHCCDSKKRCYWIESNYITALSKHWFLVNNTNWQYWQHLITHDEVRKMPFVVIDKIRDKIEVVKKQTSILNELWKTM